MRIGMPTLTEFDNLEEQIKICHKLHLNLLEINLNYPYCDLEINDLNKIKALSQEYDVAISLHYDEFADFGSFHEEIRQAWLNHFKKTVQLAAEIGAIRITTHLFEGVHVTLPNQIIYVNDLYYEKYISNLLTSLNECFQYALSYHIDFCIENVSMPPFMFKTFEILLKNDFHFTYDVGHHYEFGLVARPLFEKNWTQVKHMHLHDVIGRSPHKALGSGILDVKEMFNLARQYDIDIIIEVKDMNALKTSCQYLINL